MSRQLLNGIMLVLISISLVSCSRVTKLNLGPHYFGKRAMKIVWFQVAGFTEEHLAMLRFGVGDSNRRTSVEQLSCLGKMWNYNLYDLRPTPYEGFLSQLTGKKDIKNSCDDFRHIPIWKYLQEEGFQTGIFETPVSQKNSIERAWRCGKQVENFIQGPFLWKMTPQDKNKKGMSHSQQFHYQDNDLFLQSGVYHDKSCGQQGRGCYASIFNNVISVHSRFNVKRSKTLFIIRDFSYYNALKQGKMSVAREIISELEKTFDFFIHEANKNKNMLVILSSSSSLNFEFPKKGAQWEQFEQSGKNVIFHRSSLASSVFAKGAGAENFCGIFEEAEVLKRILVSPEKPELQFDILDWFM